MNKFINIIIFIGFFTFSEKSHSAALVLTDSTFNTFRNVYIGKFIEYFPDSLEKFSIANISSNSFSDKFLPIPFDSQGMLIDSLVTKSRVCWLRLKLINRSQSIGEWWFDCSRTQETEIFLLTNNGFVVKRTGEIPIEDRDIKIADYFISQYIPRDSTMLYFRIKAQKEFFEDKALPFIINKNAFWKKMDLSNRYYQGFFIGLFLIIAVYHLLLYFFVKEIAYVFYSLFLITFIGSSFLDTGYAFEIFWPNYPQLNDKYNYPYGYFLFIVLGMISNFFYVYFAKTFLSIKKYSTKWKKILDIHIKGTVLLLLLFIPLKIISNNFNISFAELIFLSFIYILLFWSTIAVSITLLSAFSCFRNGFKPAIYFLIANVPLVIGILIALFCEFLPFLNSSYLEVYYLADNSLKIGTSIQALIFSVGLGYKVNLLQKEKEQAQEQALEILEEKVQERTIEVVKQKDEIAEQKKKVEEHQKEVTDSIKYAKRLQEAILPPSDFIKKQFPNLFILYKPKDIVAGDFYWMEVIDDIIFIAAADCTGHGVPGAMVSVVCSNALNRTVKEFALRDTGKILDKVTDLVLETFEKSGEQIKDGMDISFLSYNKTSKQIQWSGANNPLWYIQNGQIIEVKADKQPIGKFDIRKPFTTSTIEYSENTTFYLFTDGLPDQFGGPKGKKFMYKRFETHLTEICNLSMNEQQTILEKTFADWKGTIEQVDDVTVIAIKI